MYRRIPLIFDGDLLACDCKLRIKQFSIYDDEPSVVSSARSEQSERSFGAFKTGFLSIDIKIKCQCHHPPLVVLSDMHDPGDERFLQAASVATEFICHRSHRIDMNASLDPHLRRHLIHPMLQSRLSIRRRRAATILWYFQFALILRVLITTETRLTNITTMRVMRLKG